jgi:hypothetical protein
MMPYNFRGNNVNSRGIMNDILRSMRRDARTAIIRHFHDQLQLSISCSRWVNYKLPHVNQELNDMIAFILITFSPPGLVE